MRKRPITEEQRLKACARARAWHAANREKALASSRAWYAKNKEYASQRKREMRQANPSLFRERERCTRNRNARTVRNKELRNRFGITIDQYEAMQAAQGGVCAICGQPQVGKKALAVDHDHATGAVRALLCNPCNTVLGLVRDSPERLEAAAGYLRVHACKPRAVSPFVRP